MGNCQAAEAATVVIQHGGSRVERIYWSVSANEIMASNPGHYVAMVIASPAVRTTENGTPVKQLKLLRPEDTLLLGQVYRLVSFEEVLKEFAAKKCAKLGKLLKQRGAFNIQTNKVEKPVSNSNSSNHSSTKTDIHHRIGSSQSGSSRGVGRHHPGGGGQWRPALQTITELGT